MAEVPYIWVSVNIVGRHCKEVCSLNHQTNDQKNGGKPSKWIISKVCLKVHVFAKLLSSTPFPLLTCAMRKCQFHYLKPTDRCTSVCVLQQPLLDRACSLQVFIHSLSLQRLVMRSGTLVLGARHCTAVPDGARHKSAETSRNSPVSQNTSWFP